MSTPFPQCKFLPDIAEMNSHKLMRYHCPGNSKIIHCGILFNTPYTHNGHEDVLRFIWCYCLSCNFSSLDSLPLVYSEWTYSSSLRSGEREVTPPHTQQPQQQLTQKSDTKLLPAVYLHKKEKLILGLWFLFLDCVARLINNY